MQNPIALRNTNALVAITEEQQQHHLQFIEALAGRMNLDAELMSDAAAQMIIDFPDMVNALTAQKVAAALRDLPQRSVASRVQLVQMILKAVREPDKLPRIEAKDVEAAIERGTRQPFSLTDGPEWSSVGSVRRLNVEIARDAEMELRGYDELVFDDGTTMTCQEIIDCGGLHGKRDYPPHPSKR